MLLSTRLNGRATNVPVVAIASHRGSRTMLLLAGSATFGDDEGNEDPIRILRVTMEEREARALVRDLREAIERPGAGAAKDGHSSAKVRAKRKPPSAGATRPADTA